MAALAIGAVMTALSGCAAAPPIRYYTLMPADPALRAPGARGESVHAVLEPIRLPAQVDQPQWLVRLPDDTVAVLEQERWASPLRDELRQAVREELVGAWGMVDDVAVTGPAPMRIGLDVRRFDSLISGEARITGSWSLVPGQAGARTARCEWSVREPTAATVLAIAAGHRRAVVRVAAGIGENLGRLARGEPVRCPASEATG